MEQENHQIDESILAAKFDRVRFAWLADLKNAELSKPTRRKYMSAVRSFYDWCHQKNDPILLGDVTRADVCEWRDEQARTYKAATVNQRLAAVRAFYDFLLRRGLISANPAHRVKCASRAGGQDRKRQGLTDPEVRALLRSGGDSMVDIRDRAIIHLMAFCALRTVEVARLDWEDFGVHDGRLVLWVWGKGRAEPDEMIHIPAGAEQAVRDWWEARPGGQGGPLFANLTSRYRGRRLTENYIRRMVKARMRRAGIAKSKSVESIRAAAIENAIRRGGNPLKVRRMARHKRLGSTLSYYRDDSGPVEDLIDYEPDQA